jgi:hypothetical protein
MNLQERSSAQLIHDVQDYMKSCKPNNQKLNITVFKRAIEGDLNRREIQNLLIACEMVSLLMEKTQIVHHSGLTENVIKRMFIALTGRNAPTGRPPSVVRLLENNQTCVAGSIALRHYLTHAKLDNAARMSTEGEIDIEAFLNSYKVALNSSPRGQFLPANLALHIIREYSHRNVMLERCGRCGFVYAFHCEKINTSCPCCTQSQSGKQAGIQHKERKVALASHQG